MTELSFLVELLLNHKLPKVTKDLVALRIKEVEAGFSAVRPQVYTGANPPPGKPLQAPSTMAALARHPDLFQGAAVSDLTAPQIPDVPPPPVAVIAQTPATAAAMNSRNQAIAESLAGKVDKVTGRPRKF